MFEQMRKNTKTILWITVIAFLGLIFLAWGADFSVGKRQGMIPGAIGEVNGQPIPGRQYDQLVMQSRENYKQQAGRQPDERTDAQIRSQAWNELVQDLVLRQEVERRGIRVTVDELREAILNQPPSDVQSMPQFQTDGRFDLTKYQALLRNPNFDTRSIEEQYRRSLPLQKLQFQITSAVGASDAELWESYRASNEKIKVACLILPASKFTVEESAITQGDLEAYYEGHKSSYRMPAQAVLQYVSVQRRPTELDSLNLIEQGRGILQELAEGEDFLVLVDAYSEASPQMRGGDQAIFFGSDQISDPSVKDAAFSLPVGGVSDVLPGRTGIHMIKVIERQDGPNGPQVKLADIYLPLEPSPETVATLRDLVLEVRTAALKTPLEQVAQERGLTVRETPPFGEGGFIPGIGSDAQLASFAFRGAIGEIATPVETPEGWVVARIRARQPERFAELSDVSERVRTEVLDSLRVDQAVQVAEGLLSRARAGTPLSALPGSEARAGFETLDPFPRLGGARVIGNDAAVIGPLFAASKPGLVPKVLRGRTGAFVCEVLEIVPADRAAFESQKEGMRRSLIQRRQAQVFNDWLGELKKQADVKDYRWGVGEI